MYLLAKKRAEAGQQYQKAITVLRQLVVGSRQPGFRYSLAHCCKQMGWLNLTATPPQERPEDYLQAISIYEELGKEYPNDSSRKALASCWNELAELRRRNGWFEVGEEASRRALALFQQLFDEIPKGQEPKYSLARSHNNLAWILVSRPDWRPQHAAEALEHAQKAVTLSPEDDDFYHTLGVAHCRAGHWKEALQCIEKSRRLEKNPGPPSSFDLFFEAMAYCGLGDQEKARRCYDEGVQWMEKNIPDHADLRRFRAEAAAMLKIPEEKSHPKDTKDAKDTKRKASN
jgi:tetratricopeptide (TPR) repeat protein